MTVNFYRSCCEGADVPRLDSPISLMYAASSFQWEPVPFAEQYLLVIHSNMGRHQFDAYGTTFDASSYDLGTVVYSWELKAIATGFADSDWATDVVTALGFPYTLNFQLS